MERTPETFGMVHFDYSDGNYMIDYATGDLTVFDFDNACTCWYLVDLANVWVHGVGWIQFEADAEKRRHFMDEYFATVLEGYRSETDISEVMLEHLPLFIQVTVMESVLDAFEVMQHNAEPPEVDEDLAYLIKCVEDDIPYMGFFDEIYHCDEPFEYEAQ
jgi:Ser/Thr protein kinase RdoA (MazF antagonist)